MIADLPQWALDWVRANIVVPGEPLTGRGCEDQPDLELWRESLQVELAERFDDLATADAALSDATGMQRIAEADLRREVRRQMKEAAVAETARRKAAADAIHVLREIPLKAGNPAKGTEVQWRHQQFVRFIKAAGLSALDSNSKYREALGVVTDDKDQQVCRGPSDSKITVSRATLKRDLIAIRKKLDSE